MATLSSTLGSVLGLAACTGVIVLAAVARDSPAPAGAPAPAPVRTPASSTMVVSPPSTTRRLPVTAQQRVAPQQPAVPVRPVVRDPVGQAPRVTFQPPPVLPGDPGYRRPTPWPGYQPPAGTSPGEYYRSCVAQARSHGDDRAELTCQYLAMQVPGD